jgi:PIN domain nuclease of toxin-antitoxin system
VRLLVDTHLIVWGADDPARVPRPAREALLAAERLVFSVASLWEVSIKVARGRSGIRTDPGELRAGLLRSGYEELPVTAPHALAILGLPLLHGDPFDRLLVAQARAENLILLTADRALEAYGPPVHVV